MKSLGGARGRASQPSPQAEPRTYPEQYNRERLAELRAAQAEARALFERIAGGRERLNRLLKTDQGLYDAVLMDERELVRQRLVLIRRRAEAERAIEALGNPNLRALMRMRYLLSMSWAEISAEMGYSRSQLWRMHQAAVTKLRFDERCP